jgi:hypothetical protein
MMLKRVASPWVGAILVSLVAALPLAALAKASRWLVDFDCQVLDRVLIPKAAGSAERRWYCVYGITNRTGMDRDLSLGLFVEVSGPRHERLQLLDAIDPEVQKNVEARTGRRYLDTVQVQGRLRVDERKDAIAVFGPLPRESDAICLYVVGLSSVVLEEKRLGSEYDQKLRSGQEVWLLTRGAAGATTLTPLARRIDLAEYQRCIAAKDPRVWKTVLDGEGPVHYLLDDERLTATEERRYLERRVLRRRYSRRGDEIQPQLDTYRLDGEDWILAIEPLSKAP